MLYFFFSYEDTHETKYAIGFLFPSMRFDPLSNIVYFSKPGFLLFLGSRGLDPFSLILMNYYVKLRFWKRTIL